MEGKMIGLRRAHLLVGAGLVALLAPLGAEAQTGNDQAPQALANNDGDIIVTATRREEKLSDVPASIAAFSQAKMDQQGVRDVSDIARLTPGVTFNRLSNLGSSISIRGISSGAGAATVGVYIDDTPVNQRATISSGNFSSNAYPRIFDLERVEILRGPQGTLFGASSEGGAIRFITPSPSLDKFSVYGRAEIASTAGGAASYEGGVAVGGPIVPEKLGFRGSFWFRNDGGYIDRLNPNTGAVVDKNANEERTYAARFALKWQVGRLAVTPSIFFQRIQQDDTRTVWPEPQGPNAADFAYLNYTDKSKNRYGQAYSQKQPFRQKFVLPALKLEYDGDGFDIISNTSYYSRREHGITDFTPFEVPLWTFIYLGKPQPLPINPNDKATGVDVQRNKFFTQEVRIQSDDPDARLTWTVGAFYSKNKVQTFRSVENTFLGGLLFDAGYTGRGKTQPCTSPDNCIVDAFGVPLASGRYLFVGNTTTWDTQLAGFAELGYKITDKLTLTAGVRVSRTKFKFENFADGPVNGPPAPRTDVGSTTETPITPKVGLSYKAENGNLYYIMVSDGFRIGGANVPIYNTGCDVAAVGGVPQTYDSDKTRNYEVGAKLGFLNNRLMFDGSVFLIKWKKRIGNVSIPPVGACPLSFTDNLGDVTSYGFDLAIRAQPIRGLTLSTAIGKAHATYDKDFFSSTTQTKPTVSDGDAIDGSRLTLTVSGEYAFNLTDSAEAYLRGDYTYTGGNDRTPGLNPNNSVYDPTAPNEKDPSLNLVNLRAGVRFSGLDVSAFVNNAFDSNHIYDNGSLGAFSPLHGGALAFRPRTAGVTVSLRY